MKKAKQIEYIIESLPTPEPEEVQVRAQVPFENPTFLIIDGLPYFILCV